MELTLCEHPLIKQKITLLRDKNTGIADFRNAVTAISSLLIAQATNSLQLSEYEIETPLATTTGYKLAEPLPIIIPILRAGLGMLDGAISILPDCPVGFLGMKRDESTLEIKTYAKRLPNSLENRTAILIDPMLATGGSLSDAIEFLVNKNVKEVVAACIISAPEGIAKVKSIAKKANVPVHLFVCAIDDGLNENAYIVPGLGDAGDRLYGDPGD